MDFQDGVSPSALWVGATDTMICEDLPDANYGADLLIEADGDRPSASGRACAVLMRWDLALIPPEATISAVSIEVNITSDVATATYEMYEVRTAWLENEATWNRATGIKTWEQPGALGATDRGAEVLGVFNGQALGPYVVRWTDAGVALVQAWVRNGSGNFGVIVHDAAHTNGQEFTSREAPAAVRPILSVSFDLPDAGSPDAGSPDAGSPDAGSPDAGSPDAGSTDADADAGADGGRGPLALQVGCACGATGGTGLELAAWGLAWGALEGRRRRRLARDGGDLIAVRPNTRQTQETK